MLGDDFISKKTKSPAWGYNYRREKYCVKKNTDVANIDWSLSTTRRRGGDVDTHLLGKAAVKSVMQRKNEREFGTSALRNASRWILQVLAELLT